MTENINRPSRSGQARRIGVVCEPSTGPQRRPDPPDRRRRGGHLSVLTARGAIVLQPLTVLIHGHWRPVRLTPLRRSRLIRVANWAGIERESDRKSLIANGAAVDAVCATPGTLAAGPALRSLGRGGGPTIPGTGRRERARWPERSALVLVCSGRKDENEGRGRLWAARAAQRVREAGRPAGGGASRSQRRAGDAGRGRGGKDRLAGLRGGVGGGSAGAAGGGGGVGDGAGVRRAAPDGRAGAGSPPDRLGRAQLAGGGGRGPPAGVPDRRCAVAGPGVGAGAGVRGPPAGGRIGVDYLRRAGARCGS